MIPVKTREEIREKRSKEHIKALRASRKLSQEDFANLLGVATNTINRLENGVTKLSAMLAIKLAEEFHVSMDYLFGFSSYEDGEPPCSVSCPELIEAQNLIEWQDCEITELKEKLSLIKDVATGKEQPIKRNRKPDCSI